MATGIKDKVAIIGMGCTRFGERWDMGAEELMVEAFEECIADAGIEKKDIGAAWLGTCFESINVGRSATPLSLTLRLPFIPVTRVENFCATGTEAFRGACYAVASGAYDICLALGVEKLIDNEVLITVDGKTKSIAEMGLEDFGKSGFFQEIPGQIQFTQAICCWDDNGKSQYKKAWWKYSEACRESGYFYNLARRFIRSRQSRLLLLLGGAQNENMNIIQRAVKENGTEDVLVIKNKDYEKFTDLTGIAGGKKKYAVNVHHPANTGHIYNNRKNYSSLLYSYYDQGRWAFPVEKYGNVSRESMEKSRAFYRYLQQAVSNIAEQKLSSNRQEHIPTLKKG